MSDGAVNYITAVTDGAVSYITAVTDGAVGFSCSSADVICPAQSNADVLLTYLSSTGKCHVQFITRHLTCGRTRAERESAMSDWLFTTRHLQRGGGGGGGGGGTTNGAGRQKLKWHNFWQYAEHAKAVTYCVKKENFSWSSGDGSRGRLLFSVHNTPPPGIREGWRGAGGGDR